MLIGQAVGSLLEGLTQGLQTEPDMLVRYGNANLVNLVVYDKYLGRHGERAQRFGHQLRHEFVKIYLIGDRPDPRRHHGGGLYPAHRQLRHG